MSLSHNYLVLVVTDLGMGIPPEDIATIFEPFHRGKNVSNIPGTGLGLNIVKRFIDLLRGQIEVISQVNQGTKIIIEIPFQ